MLVLAWLFGIIVAIVVVAVVVIFLNHFYRKSSRDVAIIRRIGFSNGPLNARRGLGCQLMQGQCQPRWLESGG